MITTLGFDRTGDPQTVAELAEKYTYGTMYSLANYKGPSIHSYAEVDNFIDAKGWLAKDWDRIHHFNADMATCGSGCSGNPYDANWAFNPIGHGDLHEIGHSLELSRFRMEGWDTHSSTNFYSYYTKLKYFQDTGNKPGCQNVTFKNSFEIMQDSQNQQDPLTYFYDNYDYKPWSAGARFYIQIAALSQKLGILDSGWLAVARLHAYARKFDGALKSSQAWHASKDSVGLYNYTYEEAKKIAKDEWVAIALANVLERNTVEYINMWGVELDDKATAQITSYGYPKLGKNYIAIPSGKFCESLDYPMLSVDGVETWPAEE